MIVFQVFTTCIRRFAAHNFPFFWYTSVTLLLLTFVCAPWEHVCTCSLFSCWPTDPAARQPAHRVQPWKTSVRLFPSRPQSARQQVWRHMRVHVFPTDALYCYRLLTDIQTATPLRHPGTKQTIRRAEACLWVLWALASWPPGPAVHTSQAR